MTIPFVSVTIGELLTIPDTRFHGEPIQVKILGTVFHPDAGYEVLAEILDDPQADFCSYIALPNASLVHPTDGEPTPGDYLPDGSAEAAAAREWSS